MELFEFEIDSWYNNKIMYKKILAFNFQDALNFIPFSMEEVKQIRDSSGNVVYSYTNMFSAAFEKDYL